MIIYVIVNKPLFLPRVRLDDNILKGQGLPGFVAGLPNFPAPSRRDVRIPVVRGAPRPVDRAEVMDRSSGFGAASNPSQIMSRAQSKLGGESKLQTIPPKSQYLSIGCCWNSHLCTPTL